MQIPRLYINDIQTTDKKAIEASVELSKLIYNQANKVQAIYNHSAGPIGFFYDIAETYAYAKYDGSNGGKDFTLF